MAAAVLLCCCFSVHAANTVSSAQSVATVAADGSCQVSMTITVRLEQVEDKLYFPVPRAANGVSLNGSRVSAAKSGDIRRVNLSRVMGKVAGDFSFNIQYSLHDVIHTNEAGVQEMQLPLLCGFDYTIEAMQFTVTLPGAVEAKPAFTSGYHQSSIEADLSCTVEGMTVTGTSLKPLKDHETLTMLLAVSDEMFPRSIVETQTTTTAVIAMGVCAGLALLYWLITLRYLPWGRQDTTEPPEGFDAGTLGCAAALQGADLSMTVLTWAQLGYIMIRRERGGRILLHKRMEMGNERSDFEQRCFKKLFGKRLQTDTGSYAYAQLHRSLAARPARIQELMHKHTGNTKVFRALASGIGLFGGAGIGLVMGNGAALQGFLVFLLGCAGGVSGWFMTTWAGSLFLRRQNGFYTGLLLSGLWLLLALLAGDFALGLWMVAGLLIAGLLLRISGRRTVLGKQTASRIRGLRRYLRKASREDLRQRSETDPDYFFRMAPYAIALGADKAFAAAFGGMRLGSCPYLTGHVGENMTAPQWCALLRQTTDAMEDRANKLPLEKLLGMLHSITKR